MDEYTFARFYPMKIFSWNVRGGGGRKGFLAQTRYFISKYNLDIMALMETRVNSSRAHKIIAKLNFQNAFEIPPDGFSGGMWLVWKNSANFELKVVVSHNRFIHCQIRDNIKENSWLATFVYGFPHHHLQSQLWEDIASLNRGNDLPWMIIGNLNELSTSEDKLAKKKGNSTRFNKFNNFLHTNNLMDISHIGLPYTWWNSRLEDQAIVERLDRALANPVWLSIYKEAYVENLPIIGSDHGPMLLFLSNQVLTKRFSPL